MKTKLMTGSVLVTPYQTKTETCLKYEYKKGLVAMVKEPNVRKGFSLAEAPF